LTGGNAFTVADTCLYGALLPFFMTRGWLESSKQCVVLQVNISFLNGLVVEVINYLYDVEEG